MKNFRGTDMLTLTKPSDKIISPRELKQHPAQADSSEPQPMPDTIEAVFTITRPEYIRAMRRHWYRKLNLGRDLVCSVGAMAFGFYFLMSDASSLLGWCLIGMGFLLLMMVIYATWLLPVLMYRYQPKLQSEYRLIFQESGITFQTNQLKAELSWSLYHSWLCDDEFYIMYHGKRDISVIPRRALPEQSESYFAKLLQSQIGPPLV